MATQYTKRVYQYISIQYEGYIRGLCSIRRLYGNTGAFSNREEMCSTLIQAGKMSGERIWPFPMDPDFDSEYVCDIYTYMYFLGSVDGPFS